MEKERYSPNAGGRQRSKTEMEDIFFFALVAINTSEGKYRKNIFIYLFVFIFPFLFHFIRC